MEQFNIQNSETIQSKQQQDARLQLLVEENKKLNLLIREKMAEHEKMRIKNNDYDLKVHEISLLQSEVARINSIL